MTNEDELHKRPCEMPMDLSEPDVITRSGIDAVKGWLVAPQPRPRQVRTPAMDFEDQARARYTPAPEIEKSLIFCDCYWCSMPR